MNPSWTREHAIALRNEAAARAQMCAPIVREAEELDGLITALDEILGGTPSPHASALEKLAPVNPEDYSEPYETVNETTLFRVLQFLKSRNGSTARAADVALTLGISADVARVMLSRLSVAGEIERLKRGQYRYCQR